MNSVFNAEILAEKLSKLNNSQQSIETLSHWCIFHRKKAKLIVETWDKQFHISQKEQRVPFLYLANDILQNSRRKGNEFVTEFHNVLPKAIKDLYDSGDDHGRNVVFRLVDIWEDRKVFGNRSQSLREEMLGKDPPPPLENNGRSSHSIKIVRKSPRSVRIKLAIGGAPEKIVTAFQAVHDVHSEEDAIVNKCKAAVKRVEKLEKDFEHACETGSTQSPKLSDELLQQETILQQCIETFGNTEKKRAALVVQLKEALNEQESKLEQVRTQLQVAHGQLEQAGNMRQQLLSVKGGDQGQKQNMSDSDADPVAQHNSQTVPVKISTASSVPVVHSASLVESSPTIEGQNNKSAASVAAEVAAKLAASTSSAQMLTSVLSSFAAEEAASISNGLRSTSLPVEMSTVYPPEKRPKLENQYTIADSGLHYMTSTQQATSLQPQAHLSQQFSSLQHQNVSMQHQLPSQASPIHHPGSSPMPQQPSYPPPPPPPPPSISSLQYMTANGSMVTAPYGYGNGLGVPLTGHPVVGVPRPVIQQHSSSSIVYQQHLQPPGVGYYNQPSIPTPPTVQRQ